MTEILAGRRKAFKSAGDDTTLSRFVKTPGEHKPRKFQPQLDGIGLAEFITEGRTKFGKAVKQPSDNMLKSGHNSVKLGRDVRKTMYKGYWIYALALEERKTCPASCQHWQSCYGNNMPFADRFDHTAPDFLDKLEGQLGDLLGRKPGILMRLHALGDFYSLSYVDFWMRLLARHPTLAIYGYTAHPITSDIGFRVQSMNAAFADRSTVRFSNGNLGVMDTISIADENSARGDAIICPEQLGLSRCCATCGLCWATTRTIAFLEH